MNDLFIRKPKIEIFVVYTDNFSGGIYHISEYAVEELAAELENDSLAFFSVAGKQIKKTEVGVVRIGGNIGVQLNPQKLESK